jgi:hypothetical protein
VAPAGCIPALGGLQSRGRGFHARNLGQLDTARGLIHRIFRVGRPFPHHRGSRRNEHQKLFKQILAERPGDDEKDHAIAYVLALLVTATDEIATQDRQITTLKAGIEAGGAAVAGMAELTRHVATDVLQIAELCTPDSPNESALLARRSTLALFCGRRSRKLPGNRPTIVRAI